MSLGTFCFMQPVREKTFPAWGYNMYLRNASHVLHIHHAFHMLALAVIVAVIVFVSRGHFTSPVIVLLGTLIGGSLSDLFYDDIREWKWAVEPNAYESGCDGAGEAKAPSPSLIDPLPGQNTDSSLEQPQEQQLQSLTQPGS